MQTLPQFGSNAFRVILIRKNATELLFTATQTLLTLPALQIPRCSRIAEECTAAIEHQLGMQAYCLFTPDTPLSADQEDAVRYVAMEACKSNASPPAGMCWVPACSLASASFQDSTDFAVIARCLADFANGVVNSGPFAKPEWFREVSAWVQSQVAPLGVHLTGEFRQLNASPRFSLIRFATDGPAMWFKAVGEPNLHEFPLSLEIARSFREFVPRVVGCRKEWNAWLTLEADGVPLDDGCDANAWLLTVDTLASLQITSLGRTLHLLEAGCKDTRVPSLLDLVDPFFRIMADSMEEQTKPLPPPLSRQEVFELAAEIKIHLERLAKGDIPNALGHLDFNPGNILVSSKRCVFLDWAEACIGHPFFTFQYLLEYVRRLRGADPRREELLTLSYTRRWEFFASPEEIAAALQVVPLLSVFAYAAAGLPWRDSQVARRPEIGAPLRSLVRRMKREAEQLAKLVRPCLV